MNPKIHHRGNRWIGRLGSTFAWGRSFSECGVQLAQKCPDLAMAIIENLEAREDDSRETPSITADEHP